MRISDWSSYVCSSDLPWPIPDTDRVQVATMIWILWKGNAHIGVKRRWLQCFGARGAGTRLERSWRAHRRGAGNELQRRVEFADPEPPIVGSAGDQWFSLRQRHPIGLRPYRPDRVARLPARSRGLGHQSRDRKG